MDIYILSTSRPTSTKPTTYLSSTTCIGYTFDLSHVCLPAHGEQMILSDYECFIVFWLGVQVSGSFKEGLAESSATESHLNL